MIQASKTRTTTIGIQGENKARVIAFDVSDILAKFPGASFTLIHQRSGDSSAYPVGSTELHGTTLLWTVTSADTAIAGSSYCELIATVGDVVKKTVIYSLRVAGTLDNSATPPDPWESWVQDVVDAADRADAAAALLENPGAQAETLEAGSSATAAYANGVFTFGIPRGTKGDPGQDGKDGKDGKDGTNGRDGQDGQNGQDGQDGYSPTATVSKSNHKTTITITDKNGTTTAEVDDGTPADVQWEQINEVTLAEDSEYIEIITDSNGDSFELTDMIAVFTCGQPTTGTRDYFYGKYYDKVLYNGSIVDGSESVPSAQYSSATSNMAVQYHVTANYPAPVTMSVCTSASNGSSGNLQSMPKDRKTISIRGLRIYQSGAGKSLVPSGANLTIWGKRKPT